MMYYRSPLSSDETPPVYINPKGAATNSTNFFRAIREIRGEFLRRVLPESLARLALTKAVAAAPRAASKWACSSCSTGPDRHRPDLRGRQPARLYWFFASGSVSWDRQPLPPSPPSGRCQWPTTGPLHDQIPNY